MTDEVINQKLDQFVKYRNEKKNLEALNFVEEIQKSGTEYLDIINSQILNLKNVQEPKEESLINFILV